MGPEGARGVWGDVECVGPVCCSGFLLLLAGSGGCRSHSGVFVVSATSLVEQSPPEPRCPHKLGRGNRVCFGGGGE